MSGNKIYQHTTAFGNTENGCLGHLQNIDNQHPCFSQILSSFTGKEKDSESGYYYFGARYYDCDLSGLFLSVDPMSDKYPNLSPYAYCAWNPVKLVDPDGEEIINKDMSIAKNKKKEIEGMQEKLSSFTGSKKELNRLKKSINKITREYNEYLRNGEKTEKAIQELKLLMPDFYKDIDELRDVNGLAVNVYVSITKKLKNEEKIVCGLTSLNYTQNNGTTSINGQNTVDVQINHTFLSVKEKILAHEFGHVFFNVKHPNTVREDLSNGISPSDPNSYSEKYALKMESEYLNAVYKKNE